MRAPRSHEMLVRAARLYYLEDMSQGDIAKALGLSRSSISRMLTAARERGIVEIRIHVPGVLTRVPDLESALCGAFPIRAATVVARVKSRAPIDLVGEAAAQVFDERAPHLTAFGISWGLTVDRFVEQVPVAPVHRALVICPLSGGQPSDTGRAGHTAMEVLAEHTGATSFRFECPAVVESRQTWSALSRESSIVNAIRRACQVEFAVVGIGSAGQHNSRRVAAAMRLSEAESREFTDQEPAGDICGRFYDIDGRELGLPTSERVIGISLDQLRAVPEVMGLAAGVEKAKGVVGALRTRTLDSIVVDEDLARAVLEIVGG
ncbi:MAG: helix-turn-helix domain-containing protein [Actinobacteria bacterium]|nr:helix-turn-helix domain-containing protein [Actinomycetota bacterium]